MSRGSKNVCRTSALPGASRNTATSAPTTTSVLAVETATARRPPPDSSRGPRPPPSIGPGIMSGSAGEPVSLVSIREAGVRPGKEGGCCGPGVRA